MQNSWQALLRAGQAISTRLILLVVVVAAPLIGLQFYYAIDAASSARKEALDQSHQTAHAVLARIDDHVRNVEALLVAVSSTVPPRRNAVDQGNTTLRAIKAGLPTYFGSISVIELNGNMLYSAESPPPRPGTVNVADRGYFKDALTTGRLAVGAPVQSRTSGQWIQVLARPIRDGATGSISGVVSASTLLERFQDIFADVKLPPGSVITVINLNGVVLARSVEPAKFVGTNQSTLASVQQALRDHEGAMELVSADGVTRLSGFTTSRLVPWLVYVGIPTETALAPSRTRLLWGVLLTFLVAALAIGAATWVAQGIAKPLRRLARDAATLAGGALSHRALAAAGGEVGDLAASFNAMADDLERDRNRLRDSEERFRLATSTGQVWDWNIVTNQASFFREFWRGLGYEEQNVADQTTMLESLMHPDDRPRWRQAIKEHITLRQPYDLDFRACTKSGEYRWFNTKGQARWDESGRATYMAGTTFDITDRKLAEQSNREQLDELLRWQALMIDREERMLELKAEVNELLAHQGEPARYSVEVVPPKDDK